MVFFDQRLETYLANDRYLEVKDVFVLLADLMEESIGPEILKYGRMTDFGCATGEMLYYVKQRFPDLELHGVDNSQELLHRAREVFIDNSVGFTEADALIYRSLPNDIVTCFGMIGIFDDFDGLLNSLIENTKIGGKIYLHGLFNDDEIDVRIYYRDIQNQKDWNRGFNIFSKKTISDWLDGKVSSWKFHPFKIKTKIQKNKQLPHRAYTQRLDNGELFTSNGLCLMLPENILVITK